MRYIEKYRPRNWEEIINQKTIITQIQNILSHPDDVPHMIFVGLPGTGKTSVAENIARQLLGEGWRSSFIELNASDERGIETVRETIKQYSSLVGKRVLYLGEADNMTKDAQQALRRIMELTKSTIFILSGNHEYKLIQAIRSRCAIFHFKKIEDKEILKKLIEVCKLEQIEVDFNNTEIRSGFKQLVQDSRGDMRKALNNLQKLVDEKKQITPASVVGLREPTMLKTAILTAIAGDFEKAKQIVEDEYIMRGFDTETIFNDMYHALDEIKEREVKIRCYEKLGELERNINLGTSPLVQLTAFMAFCWVAPHLPKKFPDVM